jgi:hypothetical protein
VRKNSNPRNAEKAPPLQDERATSEKELESERTRILDENLSLKKELAQLQQNLDQVLQFSSWKLTAPIRQISTGFWRKRKAPAEMNLHGTNSHLTE